MSLSAFNTTVPLASSGGRVRSAAFNDPQVRSALQRNRDMLKNAMQKTGDIKADIHYNVTIPWFKNNAASLTSFKDSGKKNAAGYPIPSVQYGWFQQFFDKFITNEILRAAINEIADPSRARNPPKDLISYKRKFGDSIRRWWVLNRNKALPVAVQNYCINGLTNPYLAQAHTIALQAKNAGRSVPDFMDANAKAYYHAVLNDYHKPPLPTSAVRRGTDQIPSSSAPQ